MDDSSEVPSTDDATEDLDAQPSVEEAPETTFDVVYSCLRCGTTVSNTELNRLPEIKCICGFRVFTKVRPPVVKSIRAI